MPRPRPTHVVITPAASPPDTAPPATPWQLGLRRFWVVLLPLVPVLLDTLIGLYRSGQIQPPSAWVPVVSVAIALYSAAAKKIKEDGRQADALVLQAHGIPAGVSLNAKDVEAALHTTATLPRTSGTPPHD